MKCVHITFRLLLIFLIITFLASFSGCSDGISAEEENALVIERLRSQIYETSPVSADTVYWLKNGSVYHLYRDCRFLSDSDNIRSGSAEKSGKSKVCGECLKRSEEESVENKDNLRSLPESTAGSDLQIVYWTHGGKVWHTKKDCPALADAKEIKSGTVEQSKKERACKICSPDN